VLSGPIPTSLSHLQDLDSLILSSNELSGTIPSEIGSLCCWYVKKYPDRLTPASIGSLLSLSQLFLEYNQLNGTIPLEIGGLIKLNRTFSLFQ
jgi:Leucine-rich repeat (LRR) protein